MSVSIAPSPFGSLSVSVAETGSTLDVSVLSTSNCVLTMDLGVPGPQGPQGEPGQDGAPGVGVPAGGSAGQVLAKVDGVDYNTEWVNVQGDYLPLAGGTMDTNALVNFSDGTNDSQIGGWGFGVEQTGNPSNYSTVESSGITVTNGSDSTYLFPTAVVASNGTSEMTVTPTGITFPDSTVQTTAWTGTIDGYRTLTDYDFTNVPDVKLSTYGLTLVGPTNDSIPYGSYLAPNGLVFNQDSTDNGSQEGVQYLANYLGQNIYCKSRQLVDVDGTLTWQDEKGYILSGGDIGLKFLQYNGTLYPSSVQYQRSQIIFGNGSTQTIAFPGFAGYATLASPAFTGNPTAPTATAGDNDTSIATTAFVTTAVSNGLSGGTAIAKNIEVEVRNQSGSTMDAGTIVYISGATGNKPLITKAQANNDANSAQTIGFVKTAIANNGTGYVITRGSLENIDTSALTEGVQLYLSPSTSGTWTTTKPYAPDHLVYVGIVIRSHPTLGIIYVSVQNGYEIDELHNVSAQTPSNLDLLSYESSTSLWKNKSFSTLGLLTSATAASTYAPLSSPAITGNVTITTNSASPALVIEQSGAGDVIQFKDQASDTTYSFIDQNGKVNTVASTTASAGLNLPHGTAPTSPVNGDLWTTTAGLIFRVNGATRTCAVRESNNTYTANTKQAFVSGATVAGASITPVTVDPSTLANGDIWTLTSDLKVRLNGATETMAKQSWVTSQGYLTTAPVTSVAGRTGAITLANTDISGLGTMATATASDYSTTTVANGLYYPLASNPAGYLTSAPVTSVAGRTGAITLAVADVSGAAPLASPTFSGTPSLPTGTTAVTQTAGDNTTALATTAFVTAAVPAFATNAQIITGTSTSTIIAPSNAGFFLANPKLRSLAAINQTAISGSGAVTANSGFTFRREMYLSTLATGRASYSYGTNGTAGFGGSTANRDQIDFSKKVWMSGYASMGASAGATSYIGDANTISRITLGGYSSVTTGDMTVAGIGIKKVGGASSVVVLTVHNGTSLSNVSSSITVPDSGGINWMIYSDGTGNVTLYINGSQAATTSSGPTGTTSTTNSAYREQVEATATPAVRQLMNCSGGWVYLD